LEHNKNVSAAIKESQIDETRQVSTRSRKMLKELEAPPKDKDEEADETEVEVSVSDLKEQAAAMEMFEDNDIQLAVIEKMKRRQLEKVITMVPGMILSEAHDVQLELMALGFAEGKKQIKEIKEMDKTELIDFIDAKE